MTTLDLGDGLNFHHGQLPIEHRWNAETFEAFWASHPDIRPSIVLHGREVQIPRWQQAFGADYFFSGQTSHALPVTPVLEPLLTWSREAIHPSLNGLLINWYEGPGHYIGPHHDAAKQLLPGVPIVTLSFGEERVFRLSRGTGDVRRVLDFPAPDGTVFVIPQETNAVWKHSVPKSARYSGRRISVTIRGFKTEVARGSATTPSGRPGRPVS